MAGRRPLPTKLKLVRGTARKHRLNPAEPKAFGSPSPPAHLDRDATTEWNRILKIWSGVVGLADRAVLASYCKAYSDVLRLNREIYGYRTKNHRHRAGEGEVVPTGDGSVKRNPKTAILHERELMMLRAAVELGLTPAARSKVRAAKKEEPTGWDAL